MSKRFVGRAAVVLGSLSLLAWTHVASAQEWLKDRRFQNGPGYQVGDFEVHPGIAGEIGYDSNWFLRSDKSGPLLINGAPAVQSEAAGMIRVTPSISISTAKGAERAEASTPSEGPKVAFNAGAAATYREFLSSDPVLRSQRNVSIDANAQALILPGRPWGANLFGTYNRTIQPTVYGDPDVSFNRDDLGLGLELIAQPNSGTLDWRVGYQVHTTLFEQAAGQVFNNLSHSIFTRGRWKFRPRTALIYDGSIGFRTYSNSSQAVTSLHSSEPVRARLGLTGLITPRLSVLAMAGYAASFYDTLNGRDQTTQQYDGVIGQLEAKFFPTATGSGDPTQASLVLSSIAVGYTRDYLTSYLGDFYGSDRGYAKIQYFFAGRALISFEGGVGAIEYPNIYFATPLGAPANVAHAPFTDIRADATLFGEYRFIEQVGVNATLRYTENFSSTTIPVVNPATPQNGVPTNAQFDMSWRRFEAYLGVRWLM